MSDCRLRSYDQSPPGGYPYSQTGDKPRNFAAQPLIEAQAHIVESYRKANGLPRSTYAEALVDVDHYQCARLGCNPSYCTPINVDAPNAVALAANAPGLSGLCKGCGARVVET